MFLEAREGLCQLLDPGEVVRGTSPAMATSAWPPQQSEEGKEQISPHGQVRGGSVLAHPWGMEGGTAGLGW